MPEPRLQLNEIFYSLQGESTLSGLPTLFVRFQGCNLDCAWCDTRHARRRAGGQEWRIADVLRRALARRCRQVCLTGGEPLLQRGPLLELTSLLLAAGFAVSLETNGSLDVGGLPPPLKRVLDLKAPGSGMSGCNRWENLRLLGPEDEVKFVVGDREDFRWSLAVVQRLGLAGKLPVLFSPVQGVLAPADLAGWILEEELPLRLQLQLHRLLWPAGEDGPGGPPRGDESGDGSSPGPAIQTGAARRPAEGR